MKKFTIAFVALALICTCVFATSYSATAGFGAGGYMAAQREIKKSPTSLGPAFSAGFDYEFDNGFTLYDDIALNLAIVDCPKGVLVRVKPQVVSLTEQLGAGYTFHVGKFDLMAGAGVGIRTVVYGLDKAMPSVFAGVMEINDNIDAQITAAKKGGKTQAQAEELIKEEIGVTSLSEKMTFTTVDIAMRFKGSYNIDDNWAISVQANPTFALKVLSNINEFSSLKNIPGSEDFNHMAACLSGRVKVVGCNAVIAATYKF